MENGNLLQQEQKGEKLGYMIALISLYAEAIQFKNLHLGDEKLLALRTALETIEVEIEENIETYSKYEHQINIITLYLLRHTFHYSHAANRELWDSCLNIRRLLHLA